MNLLPELRVHVQRLNLLVALGGGGAMILMTLN
jgi:hypothetical protein